MINLFTNNLSKSNQEEMKMGSRISKAQIIFI